MSAVLQTYDTHARAMPTARERANLLRTVSHLRKDQATIAQDSSYDDVASGGQPLSRPFTHADVIAPPHYQVSMTSNRNGGRRISLDVLRPRPKAVSETVKPAFTVPSETSETNSAHARSQPTASSMTGRRPSFGDSAPRSASLSNNTQVPLTSCSGQIPPSRDLASSSLIAKLRRKSTSQLKVGPQQSTIPPSTEHIKPSTPTTSANQQHASSTLSERTDPRHLNLAPKDQSTSFHRSLQSSKQGIASRSSARVSFDEGSSSQNASPPLNLGADSVGDKTAESHNLLCTTGGTVRSSISLEPGACSASQIPADHHAAAVGKSSAVSFDLRHPQTTQHQRASSGDLGNTALRCASRRPSLASIAAFGEEEDSEARGRRSEQSHQAASASSSPSPPQLDGPTYQENQSTMSSFDISLLPLSASKARRGLEAVPVRRRASADAQDLDRTAEPDDAPQIREVEGSIPRRKSAGLVKALFSPRKSQEMRKFREGTPDSDVSQLDDASRRGSRTSFSFLRRASHDTKSRSISASAWPYESDIRTASVDTSDFPLEAKDCASGELKHTKAMRLLRNLGIAKARQSSAASKTPYVCAKGRGDAALQQQLQEQEPFHEAPADPEEANEAFAAVFGPPQSGGVDITIADELRHHDFNTMQEAGTTNPATNPSTPNLSRPVSSASATYSFHSAPQSPRHLPCEMTEATHSVSTEQGEADGIIRGAESIHVTDSVGMRTCALHGREVQEVNITEQSQRGWVPNYSLESDKRGLMPSSMFDNNSLRGIPPSSIGHANGTSLPVQSSSPRSTYVSLPLTDSQDLRSDASQRAATHSEAMAPSIMQSSNDGGQTADSSRARRQERSSRLSQIPRLNSVRGQSLREAGGGGAAGAGGGAGGDRGNDGNRDGEGRGNNGDDTSDIDTTDEAEHDETESASPSDSEGSLESDEESEYAAMPGSLPTSRRSSRLSREGQQSDIRNTSRPSGLQMPPAPTFGEMIEPSFHSPTPTQSAEARVPLAVGRTSWTTFGADTPSETPTLLANPSVNASIVTPKASQHPPSLLSPAASRLNVSRTPGRADANSAPSPLSSSAGEPSYFNIKPIASTNVLGSTERSNGMPPPSPSIISRTRAQSSATLRNMRPISASAGSREMPPFPAVVPLNLRGADQTLSLRSRSSKGKSPGALNGDHFSGVQSAAQESWKPVETTSPARSTPRPLQRPATGDPHRDVPKSSVRSIGVHREGSHGTQMRPGLYAQQSRSLIDLTSPLRTEHETPLPLEPLKSPPLRLPGRIAEEIAPIEPASLRRRRSMYEVGAAPPPYATAHKVFSLAKGIDPREEEGSESLPSYCCSVHIEGYLPRKMEFSAPGIQSKDRSWRRMYFVLHGTSLRVYKTDLSNEKAVSRADYGSMEGVHVHPDPMSEEGPNVPDYRGTIKVHAQEEGAPSHEGTNGDNEKLAVASTGPMSRTRAGPLGNESGHGVSSHGHTRGHTRGGSQGGNASGVGLAAAVESALTGTISHIPFSGGKAHLVKQYTLQGAESGLAADYLKRRHVVRVRAEGEQFLLQTRNDRHVVDWIEAFQAGTNIAMDLERRPMPKFITLPRRRRRRRRETADNANALGGAALAVPSDVPPEIREAAELAEAQRRSLMDSGNSVSNSRPRGSTNQRNGSFREPDPSAAFERMLREEEEDQSRQQNAGETM